MFVFFFLRDITYKEVFVVEENDLAEKRVIFFHFSQSFRNSVLCIRKCFQRRISKLPVES